MSQISRLRDSEISNGNLINADDLDAEFNALYNESNSQDTRITAVEAASVSASGNNTFTGTNTFSHATIPIKTDIIAERTAAAGVTIDSVLLKDGMVKVSGDPAANGTLGYTSNLAKFYANGAAYWLPLLPTPSGNGSKALAVNSGGTGWEYIATPSTISSYLSTGQTITSAGTVTLTHSLGYYPKFYHYYLKCTDAAGEAGYAQNDFVEVYAGGEVRSTSTSHGFSVKPTTTQLVIRYASDANVFMIPHATTGDATSLTNSKWQLFVEAFRF